MSLIQTIVNRILKAGWKRTPAPWLLNWDVSLFRTSDSDTFLSVFLDPMFPSFQTGPAHWPSWILQTVGLASLHNCMRQFLKINLFLFLSPLPHSCSSIYICTHTHTLLIYFLFVLLLLWRTLTNAHPYHWSLEGRPFSSSGLSEMEAHGLGPIHSLSSCHHWHFT